jgi:hypothetical protein
MKKLGTIVTDSATGLKGMITQFEHRMGGQQYYLLQPRALNPKDGEPVKQVWLDEPRITNGIDVPLPEYWPLEILGTHVEDEASGYAGMAIAICQHISGCIHVNVQSKGQQETGAAIDACNFDIRRLSGAALKKLSETERMASQKEKPSPGEMMSFSPKI